MAERLSDILAGMDAGVLRTVELCSFLTLWPEVVDKGIAKHAQAVKIRNRTLYVSTSSPAWAQELSYLKQEIMGKFNKLAGKEVISEIRFSTGPQVTVDDEDFALN